MIRNRLSLQIGVLALLAAGVVAALALGSQQGHTVRVAAFDLGGVTPVVRLVDGGHVCESPVAVDGEFQRLVFWNGGVGSKALVSIHRGSTPSAKTVALGFLEVGSPLPGENVVTLTQAVAPSADLTVCVKAVQGAVTLWGGKSQYLSNFSGSTYGAPVIRGFQPASALWLQAWSTRPHGILSSLPLAFRRMSLFRFNWIGAWTFWIVLFGVLAGFPLLVLAVRSALKAESERSDDSSTR